MLAGKLWVDPAICGWTIIRVILVRALQGSLAVRRSREQEIHREIAVWAAAACSYKVTAGVRMADKLQFPRWRRTMENHSLLGAVDSA